MTSSSQFILLTGQPGVGKTTFIKQLVANLKTQSNRVHLSGFYTGELRDASKTRVGFAAVSVNASEQRCTLSSLKKNIIGSERLR